MTPQPIDFTKEVAHDCTELRVEQAVAREVRHASWGWHIEVREPSQDILVFRQEIAHLTEKRRQRVRKEEKARKVLADVAIVALAELVEVVCRRVPTWEHLDV